MMPIIILVQIVILILGIILAYNDYVMLILGTIIAYNDYKSTEIYNWQIYLMFILTFIFSWVHGEMLQFFFGGAAALIINLLIFFGAFIVYRSEQYGFGDVMIHVCIGGYLGIEKYLNYYAISSITLGIIAVGTLIWTKQKTVPLAPFLFGLLLIYKLIGEPNLLGIYF